MQIDIRKSNDQAIEQIQFWDTEYADAHFLVLQGIDTYIADGADSLYIRSVEHAEYLIKALQKAIELGNWND